MLMLKELRYVYRGIASRVRGWSARRRRAAAAGPNVDVRTLLARGWLAETIEALQQSAASHPDPDVRRRAQGLVDENPFR